MKCNKCSIDVDEGKKICPNCSYKLIGSEEDDKINNNKNIDDNNSEEELSTTAKLIWAFVFTAVGFFIISGLFGDFIIKSLLGSFLDFFVFSSGCY